MERLIIRVDDVSPNTNIHDLNHASFYLSAELGAEIWYCVNLFSKYTSQGSVYPDLPMRGRGLKYFTDVDSQFTEDKFPDFVKIVSHGLIHAEHGKLSKESQFISIMTSCKMLNSKIFVPPFISYDSNTQEVCSENGITLIDGKDWKSMETEKFDPTHKLWFFHHWRMDFKKVKEWADAGKVVA